MPGVLRISFNIDCEKNPELIYYMYKYSLIFETINIFTYHSLLVLSFCLTAARLSDGTSRRKNDLNQVATSVHIEILQN